MSYFSYKEKFDTHMGVKIQPSNHEKALFSRAEKYIKKIAWIPGLRMIAIVNSLSMNAIHKNSDIDLFIVTAKNRIWIVRFLLTFVFWMHGVWRHGEDIAGNFCLSFFIEEDAMNMSKIALQDDIYLYFWMYYMKPMLLDGEIWKEFQQANPGYNIQKNGLRTPILLKHRIQAWPQIMNYSLTLINSCIRFFGERVTLASFQKKGCPEGVIIQRNILKFHDQDKRSEVRKKLIDN